MVSKYFHIQISSAEEYAYIIKLHGKRFKNLGEKASVKHS